MSSQPILLFKQINDIKTFSGADNKEETDILKRLEEWNTIEQREEMYNKKFIVSEPDKLKLAKEVNTEIKQIDNYDLKTLIQLYVKIINPINVIQQLLQFEFNNIVYEPSKETNTDNIKQLLISVLTRYKIKEIDDINWKFETNDGQLLFRNTFLDSDYDRIQDFIQNIRRIFRQLFPKADIYVKCKDLISHCNRRIVTIYFEL